MEHRKIYRIFEEEEKELVYEDILNESGQILSFKDYQSPNQAEGFSEYDANGVLIFERDIIDGEEGSRTEYSYNSNGDIIRRDLFVAGELFEEVSYEYLNNGIIKRTLQHGQEIERFIENKNGDTFLREFFEGTELIERHEGKYDPNTRIELINITDNEGNIIATRLQEFDDSDNLLKYEEKNEKGNLIVLSEYSYENSKVVFEKHNDYSLDQHYEVFYKYDSSGNLTSQEIRTPSGKLLEYQKQIFDEYGRVISESGYSVGSFNAIYGTYVHGEKYTFEHEYEEK
ncbi:hypothetical protein C9994_10420 [Marivirga lumbricoides]|uniref:Sugar-binding protein n=1 Tax=Marivirga lumbricoides TaxID=1046115 RepID=A0A2T4DPJ9_9BACT|nr:hypothetical protein C9994_10420 [Marivirga lumbricoides]